MDLLLDMAERQRIDFGRIALLPLIDQFTAAMEHEAPRVSLERRADWLVLATRLVLLRSRLLFPVTPEAAADAEAEAATEVRRLDERLVMRAAGGWLGQRPVLGIETFVRPVVEPPREGGYVALLEACLAILRGPQERAKPDPVYARTLPDLWRVSDALRHIPGALVNWPEGEELSAFLPLFDTNDPDLPEKKRTALASTLLACLELAKQGQVTLSQTGLMTACWVSVSRETLKPPAAEP